MTSDSFPPLKGAYLVAFIEAAEGERRGQLLGVGVASTPTPSCASNQATGVIDSTFAATYEKAKARLLARVKQERPWLSDLIEER